MMATFYDVSVAAIDQHIKKYMMIPSQNRIQLLKICFRRKIEKLRNDIQKISKEKRSIIFKKGSYSFEIGQDDIRHCKKESMSVDELVDYITN